MAPEYLRGKTEYNCPCDVYSFAIIMWEIYSREDPYHGEHPRKVLRKICDPRHNKRPEIPPTCPPKMVDVMKKAWSPDPFFRPQAKDLDMIFMDCSVRDVEPLEDEDAQGAFSKAARTDITGDMLYEIFPRKVADQLKAGQKVEPEQHDNCTVVFSDIVHFQDISSRVSPLKITNVLDRLYDVMDKCAKKNKVFKVETGKSYFFIRPSAPLSLLDVVLTPISLPCFANYFYSRRFLDGSFKLGERPRRYACQVHC